MTQEASAIISAVIPLTMRSELERRAQEADRSLSSEIRRAIRAYLEVPGGLHLGVAERDGWHEATFVLNTDKPLWDVDRDLLRVGTPVSIGAKSLLRDESLADLGLATPVRRHTTAVLEEVSILSPGVMPGYKGAKIIRITERGTARDRMRERQLERERADAKLKARASASAWPPGTIVRDLGDGREEITYPNGGPPLARRNIGEVLGVR